MRQTAVFVDAGYLFAAGSALIAGEKRPRTECTLSVENVLESIQKHALSVEPDARLLRTYWYDGVRPFSGPNPEQVELGKQPFLKLRFGMLNSQGQQKGVDSLIVTDLIDLARNRAINDALILAGDEDLRVGVQVAQSLGVRVHLLGVEPTRGNVSQQLRQEVDSISELTGDEVKSFLTCAAKPAPTTVTSSEQPAASSKTITRPPLKGATADSIQDGKLSTIVEQIFGRFGEAELAQFAAYLEAENSLPRDIDAPILAQGRHELGRDLSVKEKREARAIARSMLEKSK